MNLRSQKGWSDVGFKKDQYGNTLFYPWGIAGKGRVLADQATEHNVRSLVRRLNIISPLFIVFFGMSIGWVCAIGIGLIIAASFQMRILSLLKGCSCSDEKLTLKESFTKIIAFHSKPKLWLLFVVSILFVIAGAWMEMTTASTTGRGIVIFFGACAALAGYMLTAKNT